MIPNIARHVASKRILAWLNARLQLAGAKSLVFTQNSYLGKTRKSIGSANDNELKIVFKPTSENLSIIDDMLSINALTASPLNIEIRIIEFAPDMRISKIVYIKK